MASATFKFSCPHCGQHLEAEMDWVGMQVECPGCGKAMIVPSFKQSIRPTIIVMSKHKLAPVSTKTQPNACNPAPSHKIAKLVYGIVIVALVGIGVFAFVASFASSARRKARSAITIATSAIDAIGNASPNDMGNSIVSLTDKERNAIGAIIWATKRSQPDSPEIERITRKTWEPRSESALEILKVIFANFNADTLEDGESWEACPHDFQVAAKRAFTAMGKAEIAAVVKKYGKEEVLRTLRQYDIPENYRKYYYNAMSKSDSSILDELQEAKRQFNIFLSKHSLSESDLELMADEYCSVKKENYADNDDGGSRQPNSLEARYFEALQALHPDEGKIKDVVKAYKGFVEVEKMGYKPAKLAIAHTTWIMTDEDKEELKANGIDVPNGWGFVGDLMYAADVLELSLAKCELGLLEMSRGNSAKGLKLVREAKQKGSLPAEKIIGYISYEAAESGMSEDYVARMLTGNKGSLAFCLSICEIEMVHDFFTSLENPPKYEKNP